MTAAKERGLSPTDIAAAMGVTVRQAQNYLSSAQVPQRDRLVLLARILGLTAEDILLSAPPSLTNMRRKTA
jgi:transcriptional regulator with XRE-family HTH domain